MRSAVAGERYRRAICLLGVLVFGLLGLVSLAACTRSSAQAGAPTSTGGKTTIQNKGSDTLVNVALAWAEAYRDVNPNVSIAVTGGGSGTGIAALINGTVDIANASRQMKPEERQAALDNGIEPVQFVVAIDAIAVIVHPSNPVDRLTLQQLGNIYTGKITNWKEVGGRDAPIILLSRETNSGTHVYFLEEVVRKGTGDEEAIFAPQTLLMPSSFGITSEIRRNPNAIGYDGLGYVTEDEKVLAVARDSESPYVLPRVETASDGSYPIARELYMYTPGEPTGPVAEYLDWIRSPTGQEIVAKVGFVPLTAGGGS